MSLSDNPPEFVEHMIKNTNVIIDEQAIQNNNDPKVTIVIDTKTAGELSNIYNNIRNSANKYIENEFAQDFSIKQSKQFSKADLIKLYKVALANKHLYSRD